MKERNCQISYRLLL